MGIIVYTCPYVPREWIAAHGLTPSRCAPRPADGNRMREGACAFMAAFAAGATEAPGTTAVVLTTACDQMRRAYDVVNAESGIPVFLMHVPATWQTVEAQRLYVSELRRLGAFLVACGGRKPPQDALAQVMRETDDARKALLDTRPHLSPRAFSEAIMTFHETGTLPCRTDRAPPSQPEATPVALLGGPLLPNQLAILDCIATHGGTVVLDGTETGERTLARPFDRRRLNGDPLHELADAYFGTIPDVRQRPNSRLYQWLEPILPERGARGVILLRQSWCDLWHAETARIKAWLDIPLLDLELDETGAGPTTFTRIEAFLEALA